MLKKMMLLALAAAAIVAVAAPAAQANRLWHGGPALTGGTGSLASVSQSGLSTGPAPVTFSGTVTNGGTTGSINTFVINGGAGGIPTNVPGCTAQGTVKTPMATHLITPDTTTITNVTRTYHYSGQSCAAAGIPPTIGSTGDITLTITGARSGSANPYDDALIPTLTLYNLATQTHILPIQGDDIKGTVSWTGGGTIT